MKVFMTTGFARLARRARITDSQLCDAAQEASRGLAIDLGGGVYKKRLGENRHRAIILARGREYWFYVYLYAKQNRADLDPAELKQFRRLAKGYDSLTSHQLAELLRANDLKEINCSTSQVQKPGAQGNS